MPRKLNRSLVLPNLAGSLLYSVARFLGAILGRRSGSAKAASFLPHKLAIEAGEAAWDHIFFKELKRSAEDYLGAINVQRVVIRGGDRYIQKVNEAVSCSQVTHYFYDPRTGSQSFARAIFESFLVMMALTKNQVTPIAYCTDISLRRWRYQVGIVTARNGLCVSLSPNSIVQRMFPHDRILGPTLMPLSHATFQELGSRAEAVEKVDKPLRVAFFGSLYEPRISQLREIADALKSHNIDFHLGGRKFGDSRISEDDYWSKILSSDVVISTSSQILMRGLDQAGMAHLIYRFTEVLACGVCLVAQRPAGVEKYFSDGKDLFLWDSPREAAQLVVRLKKNRDLMVSTANQGRSTIGFHVQRSTFWAEIWLALD